MVGKINNMYIQEILDSSKWQNFVVGLDLNTFLHSKNWAEFNYGKGKIWKLGLFNSFHDLVSVALVIKIKAKRGTFLLVPHGPQYGKIENEYEVMEFWTQYLKKLSQDESCSFFRIQPILVKNEVSQSLFNKLNFRPAPIHMHTELSSVLDITPSQEDLLLGMRKTTRQMIKKALSMVISKELEVDFPVEISSEMHQVYKETYLRGGAVAYSPEYIEKEWQVFSRDNKAKLVSISYQGKIISWGLIIIFGNRAFYHQGGNILFKNIPNSYLLQWQGILFAKQSGCITYDFWGVSPSQKPNHPWANISLFKRGFGGVDVELLHAQDYIVSNLYWFNWIIEKYRAYRRGF